MIDKKHLESILKINGVAVTSPDEQIRSVLLSARFNNDEIDTALMVLRENTKTNETHVDGLHKVFRTDNSLGAKEISDFLGVNVNINETINCNQTIEKRYTLLQVLVLWLVSMILAVTGVLFYMYTNDIGVFHPSSPMMSKS